jgi:hypothetical protein
MKIDSRIQARKSGFFVACRNGEPTAVSASRYVAGNLGVSNALARVLVWLSGLGRFA